MKLFRIVLALLLLGLAAKYAHADTKISALPTGSALTGTELLPIVQGGSTVATTPAAITTYVDANAAMPASAITSGIFGVARGGTGLGTLTAHGVILGEGTSNVSSVAAMAADTLLAGQGTGSDPAAVSLLNCGDATHALAYSTSTHTFSCQAITGLSTPVTVPNGGTGLATLTAHGVLLGEGTSNLGNVAAMAADTLLQGQGSTSDPAAVALVNCGSASQALAYSTTTHTFSCQTISTVATPVTVPNGGTGLATLTSHGLLLGEGTGNVGSVAAMAADTLLQGQGATTDPAAVAVSNCGDATHALAYSTSSHAFSCQAITGSGSGPITLVRTANSSLRASNASPTCDSTLTTTIASDGLVHYYSYEAQLDFFSSVATGGWQWSKTASVTGSGASFPLWQSVYTTNTTASDAAVNGNGDETSNTTGAAFPATNVGTEVHIHGIITTSTTTTATVCVAWAQNVSNATGALLAVGSYLVLTKLN